MHPAQLRSENTEYTKYSLIFAPCRPGARTPTIANLCLHKPYAEKVELNGSPIIDCVVS